jgi:hypothetical protein
MHPIISNRMARASTLALLLLAACNRTPEPEPGSKPAVPEPASSPTSSSPQASAPGSSPTEVTWEAPAGWSKASNPSPMRKATYKIPRVSGDPEDADLSVTQAGGSVEANIKRWAAQFEHKTDTKRTERNIGALKITIVELEGTFTGGGMPGMAPTDPKKNWAMVGAIVETTPVPTFFKLTGPLKSVRAARPDFDKLVGSIRPQ